jgi:hypothetical protein
MKPTSSSRADPSAAKSAPVARRGLIAGVGVAAGAAVAAHLVSRSGTAPEAAVPADAKAAEGQGYRLTAHVQRYYETTKA